MPEPYWIAFELGLESPYRTDGYSCWQLVPEVEAAIEQWMFVNRDVQVEWHAAAEDRQRELRALGWPHDISRSWWEADHIKPVVEGGGQCGLENLRTLCVPCHKRATAELAARRAQERKRAKQPELQLQP